MLCVAQKREHKNLANLIRAVAGLEDDVELVLVGSATPHEAELRALAVELGVADRIRFPGWLSDAQLEGLYRLATVFVLPSLEEGFGLPLLEAMRRGVPVACSNVSSLPEVVGNAAALFDPLDVDDMRAVIGGVLADPASGWSTRATRAAASSPGRPRRAPRWTATGGRSRRGNAPDARRPQPRLSRAR